MYYHIKIRLGLKSIGGVVLYMVHCLEDAVIVEEVQLSAATARTHALISEATCVLLMSHAR